MTTSEIAFVEIVASFDETPHCEGSDRCTRPARWRVNLHGCEQAIMCGHHKSAWLRKVLAQAGSPRCAHCGQVFSDVAAAFSVVGI